MAKAKDGKVEDGGAGAAVDSKTYYDLEVEEVLLSLKTEKQGLGSAEAKKRLEKYGLNELRKERGTTILSLLMDQFKSPLLLLLAFASIVSLFLREYLDAAAMLFIIILNVTLGFIQEYRAEKAVEALRKISAPTAKVLRGGKIEKIPAKEIVPGDIILLEAGDIVPADSRIFEESSMRVEEASLTGESLPSSKEVKTFKKGTPVADQENMVFMGTVVSYGKGKAVVVSTGMNTEFGKIALSIQETKDSETPLQRKLGQIAKQIGIVVLVLIGLMSIIRFAQGEKDIAMLFMFAMSLTVAAVPNSLPVVVTVGLSMGTRRLAAKNMIIKKLPAAESLGSVTVICSDKTGTITKNQMTITKIFQDDKIIDVSGVGYEPHGTFTCNKESYDKNKLDLAFKISYLCNNADLVESDKKGKYEIIGDPTEGSLIVLAKKGKLDEGFVEDNFSLIEELPFDSDRKMMSVIFNNKESGKIEAFVKGAPDLLLNVCTKICKDGKISALTEDERNKIHRQNEAFANQALRVLGLAYRELPSNFTKSVEFVEKDLVFVGLVGMIDPPREEVKASVKSCETAGIEIMIITGDHALTTKAIAQQIGIFKEGDRAITGEDLDAMSDEQLAKEIVNIRIIARALPLQKSRIVDALKKNGHIVAMTGDGVNDAPALKKADIGIAMGITGTDVAKEVSKAILVDDNFSTIVNAIEEGRNIYDKMIRSVRYLLACNMGEIVSVFLAILLKLPLPLLPLQILLMNLLTDDFPSLGLGFEGSDDGVMERPPRDPKERPLSNRMIMLIVAFGVIMGLGTLFMFTRYSDGDIVKARTVAFTTLVMFEMFAVISSRSLFLSPKKWNLFTNPWLLGSIILSVSIQVLVIYVPFLQNIFGTASLSLMDWVKILAISCLGFVVMEVSKIFLKLEGFKKRKLAGAAG